MGFRLNWQRRSTVVLAGVTLVIGFILITLAVREAEREKLARERDLEGEQQRYATLFTEEVDSLFSEVEKEMASAAANSEKQWDLQNLPEVYRLAAENEDLIGDIFLAGENDKLAFPLKGPLYLTPERRHLAAKNLEKIESIGREKTKRQGISSRSAMFRSISDAMRSLNPGNRFISRLWNSGFWNSL